MVENDGHLLRQILAQAQTAEDGVLDLSELPSSAPELMAAETLADRGDLRALSARRYQAALTPSVYASKGRATQTQHSYKRRVRVGIFFILALIALLLYFF